MINQAANWPTLSLALERDRKGVTCISLVMQDRLDVRREKVPASLLGLGGRLDAAEHRGTTLEQTYLQQSEAEWTERLLGKQSEPERSVDRNRSWIPYACRSAMERSIASFRSSPGLPKHLARTASSAEAAGCSRRVHVVHGR